MERWTETLERRLRNAERKYNEMYDSKIAEYAAMAMQGFCANPSINDIKEGFVMPTTIADMAVKQAKALLKELEKEGDGGGMMNKTKIKLTKLPDELEIHVADKQMNWQRAMDYAESIGMRLPTKFELQAIAESTDEFNHLDWCWSSSTTSYSTTYAWLVNLYVGFTYNNVKSFTRSVLCVNL